MHNSIQPRKDRSAQGKRNQSVLLWQNCIISPKNSLWVQEPFRIHIYYSMWHLYVHANCLIYLVHVDIFNHGLKLISVLVYFIILCHYYLLSFLHWVYSQQLPLEYICHQPVFCNGGLPCLYMKKFVDAILFHAHNNVLQTHLVVKVLKGFRYKDI